MTEGLILDRTGNMQLWSMRHVCFLPWGKHLLPGIFIHFHVDKPHSACVNNAYMYLRYTRDGQKLVIPNFMMEDAGELCCTITVLSNVHVSLSDTKCTDVYFEGKDKYRRLLK